MSKRKKQDDIFLRKKTEEKQNRAAIMLSVDTKGSVTLNVNNIKGYII